MKRKELLLLAAAALTLGSCTQQGVDEIAPQQKVPIEFSTHVGKATRAEEDVTGANLTKFYVWGGTTDAGGTYTEVFGAEEVRKSGGTWTTESPKYWADGKTYWFAATNTNGHMPTFTYDGAHRVPSLTLMLTSMDGTFDLVTAIPDNSYTYTSSGSAPTVSFTFKHLLSKVQFTFQNESSKTLQVSDITLGKVGMNGEVVLWSDGTVNWSPSTITNVSYEDVTLEGSSTSKTVSRFIRPQSLDNQTLTCTVTGSGFEDKQISIKLPKSPVSNWDTGKVYNYTLSITQETEPIKFEVSGVESWGNANEGDLGEEEMEVKE